MNDRTDLAVGERKARRGAGAAVELRWISWVLLVLYSVVAFFVFFVELRRDNPFYPTPIRYYYGSLVMPAFTLIWLGFLVLDAAHRFRSQWLAAAIVGCALVIVGYVVIDELTVVPG